MRDVFFKPSQQIEAFLPEGTSVDTGNFKEFLNAYYEWLQTTRIVITDITGTFQVGETLIGQTSGARGVICEIGSDYLVIQVESRLRFSVFETVVGTTSSASATIESIKDNVIRATGNLLEYRDIEKSIDDYADYLRQELFPTIPTKYIRDEKLVASQLKTFFQSRSNEESFRFFFKLLYNENIEFRIPGEEILRASDGKFEKTNFIRVVPVANIFEFNNRTVRGETSGAFGTIVDIKRFFFGPIEIAELTLRLVSGTFLPNETIVDVTDPSLTTTTYGMLTGFNIIDGGSGYTPGDAISISGDGNSAIAVVSSVTQAPISALTVNEVGHGYRLNTQAIINNAGTGGTNLSILVTGITNTYSVTDGSETYTVGEISRISIINRGENYFRSPIITIEDSAIAALGLLSDRLIEIADAGVDYGVGNTLVFTGGSGANAAGQVASVVETITYDFLLEDDSRIIIDGSLEDILKDEDWDVVGPIRRIELTNFGDGYTTNDLPAISVNTTTGSGANLIATNIQGRSADVSVDTANNVAGVGAIRAIQIDNPGLNYTTATADASASGDGNANLQPIITGLSIKEGEFINDDGKIGIRILIDSFFFQDFSYVIKSGLPFSVYRDELKKIIHPAGLQPFGEILLTSSITMTPLLSSLKRTIIIENEIDISTGATLEISVSEIKVDIAPLITVAVSDISAIAISEIEVAMQLEANVEPFVVDTKMKFQIEKFIDAQTDVSDSVLQVNIESENDVVFTVESQAVVTKYMQFGVESTFDVSKLNFQIEKLIGTQTNISDTIVQVNIESESDANSTFEPQSLVTKYKQIQGTVSSASNTEFKDFMISEFADVPISAIANFAFEDTIPLIVGNGTIFTSDFIVGDTLLANNELFTVSILFDDTVLAVNRNPDSPFTDVFAYKVIP